MTSFGLYRQGITQEPKHRYTTHTHTQHRNIFCSCSVSQCAPQLRISLCLANVHCNRSLVWLEVSGFCGTVNIWILTGTPLDYIVFALCHEGPAIFDRQDWSFHAPQQFTDDIGLGTDKLKVLNLCLGGSGAGQPYDSLLAASRQLSSTQGSMFLCPSMWILLQVFASCLIVSFPIEFCHVYPNMIIYN